MFFYAAFKHELQAALLLICLQLLPFLNSVPLYLFVVMLLCNINSGLQRILFCGLFILTCQWAWSQFSADEKLERRISFLSKKFFLDLPAGSEYAMRNVNPMEASPDSSFETRVECKRNGMKLVFYCTQLYKLANKDYLEKAANETGAANYSFQKINQPNIQAIITTPKTFSVDGHSIILGSLLIRNADNTMSRLTVYAGEEQIEKADDLAKLCFRIFKTLKAGLRSQDLKAHTEEHEILGAKHKCRFQIPENYVVITRRTHDFVTYTLRKLTTWEHTTWAEIQFYFGFYPSYVYEQAKIDATSGINKKGNLFDTPIYWLTFYDIQSNSFLKEQIMRANELSEGMYVHVNMSCMSEKELDTLTAIVESTKLMKLK